MVIYLVGRQKKCLKNSPGHKLGIGSTPRRVTDIDIYSLV